ncbi:MAG TPA: hypothetical protein VLC28_13830 [Flavitalea sp.]|nr:hypothetical protein [Flavitalea sp.]
MKTILMLLSFTFSFAANAQQASIPAIHKGTKLNYVVFANGDEVPMTVTLDSVSANYVKLGWNIGGYGSGGWVMKQPSLEKGNRNAWEQPGVGMDTELPDDQVVLLLSRASWAALQAQKKAEIDQQVFTVGTPASGHEFALGGKSVDALFIQNQTSGSKMWFLKQAELPVLLKIQGNAAGYDLELRSIE